MALAGKDAAKLREIQDNLTRRENSLSAAANEMQKAILGYQADQVQLAAWIADGEPLEAELTASQSSSADAVSIAHIHGLVEGIKAVSNNDARLQGMKLVKANGSALDLS